MTNLDSPSIGRKIVYLMHHDRDGLIAILSGTLPSCWPDLASAYLQELGCTELKETVPGVLFVWSQLVREYNAAEQHRSHQSRPDQSGESR